MSYNNLEDSILLIFTFKRLVLRKRYFQPPFFSVKIHWLKFCLTLSTDIDVKDIL